jgi:hypothetical protein
MAPPGETAAQLEKKPGSGRSGRSTPNSAGKPQVTPAIAQLDQQIALHQATLEGAGAHLERRQATTRAVVDHALDQQRAAQKLASQLRAHRDHLDGVPSVADIRRAATRQAQLRDLNMAPQAELITASPAGPEL